SSPHDTTKPHSTTPIVNTFASLISYPHRQSRGPATVPTERRRARLTYAPARTRNRFRAALCARLRLHFRSLNEARSLLAVLRRLRRYFVAALCVCLALLVIAIGVLWLSSDHFAAF